MKKMLKITEVALDRGNVKIICLQCSVEFLTYESQVKHRGVKFCSRGCYSEHRKKHKEKNCERCDKAFTPRSNKGKVTRFCSMGCYKAAMKANYTNTFWKNCGDISDKSACWNYKVLHTNGYGVICVNGKNQSAHRFSYELHNGKIKKGLHCLHRCDNPSCVNPDHLFLGTHADNMADMAKKGRAPGQKGSKSPNALLNEQHVKDIKDSLNAGIRGAHLAIKYGVSACTISAIKKGRVWVHVNAD